jgi:hypothetical protein
MRKSNPADAHARLTAATSIDNLLFLQEEAIAKLERKNELLRYELYKLAAYVAAILLAGGVGGLIAWSF